MTPKQNLIQYIKSFKTSDWRECWGCYQNIISHLEQMSDEKFEEMVNK